MKIRDLTSNKNGGMFAVENERKIKQSQVKVQDFKSHLQKADANQWQEKLEQLLQDIEKQGQKLGKQMTIRELKLYKGMIKTFINEVVNRTYTLKEDASFDRRGRHKLYTLIDKIDVKLEELTDLVINQEQDGLKVLEKLDEIKGLLIDIYS